MGSSSRRSQRRSFPHVLATMAVAAGLVMSTVVFAFFSWRAMFNYLPSLNLMRPALATVPAVLGPAPVRSARRVVLVIVDGLRLDTSFGLPFLDGLRERGINAKAQSHFPSLSRPNYVSIIAGVQPRYSGVRGNGYKTEVPLDSLVARARAGGLRVSYVSNSTRSFPQLFGDRFAHAAIAPWPGGMERAANSALMRTDELVILLPGDVDEVAHQHGADSAEYRQTAKDVDAMLGRVFRWVDLEQDAVIVVADHGHLDRGGHGGVEEEVLTVPLVLAGAGIRRGTALVNVELIDIAPTAAALLGLPAPGHGTGNTLVHALSLPPDQKLNLLLADEQRHAALHPAKRAAEREDRRLALAGRLRRGALTIALMAALIALTIVLARRHVILIDRRVLTTALPAFPVMFYGLVLYFEGLVSPSRLPDEGGAATRVLVYGGVAALANLIAAWRVVAGRRSPPERLAAATGLTLVGLLIALAPAGAAWVAAGKALAIDLPSPGFILIPPVTYAAVCCYAASATFTLIIEYIVFLARATDTRRIHPEPVSSA